MNTTEGLHFPEKHFHAYLDGELSRGDRYTFEAHIKTCSACRSNLQTLNNLFMRIESLPPIELDHDLSSSIMRLINAPRKRNRRWWMALVMQVLASSILFWVAWPLVEPYSQAVQDFDWESSITDIASMVSDQIGEFSQSVILFFEQNTMRVSAHVQSFDLDLVENLVVPLLISATLLWVIGNGLLLGERKIIQ
jgi:predicted anti-sigma-YlaC factor YlaD